MANSLESLVNLLESYRGRDKVIRTLCYGSLLAGGIVSQRGPGSSQLGNRLLLFSSQLSDCRTVLRLFDDLSMFAYTWSYGLGVSEEDAGVRWICVINNLADQLYYPLEHIAWAADARLIGVKSARWWTLSTLMWAVSLLMNILRSVRVILLLRKKMRKNRRTNQREGSHTLLPTITNTFINSAVGTCSTGGIPAWMGYQPVYIYLLFNIFLLFLLFKKIWCENNF
ncbi:peroxisomal membrane protein 11C isoform X2 [Brienomyrus brachyistius]|uniref:peroxisomal membrane protein 11C isoform X2 n=1 Tax=Brienomyrus brachyistius TaxID=42636 RepID=UPI0020B2A5BF|nr:peroxisomal membrane protein 11C isoform X2 [Brienomyrus brachyistius]